MQAQNPHGVHEKQDLDRSPSSVRELGYDQPEAAAKAAKCKKDTTMMRWTFGVILMLGLLGAILNSNLGR